MYFATPLESHTGPTIHGWPVGTGSFPRCSPSSNHARTTTPSASTWALSATRTSSARFEARRTPSRRRVGSLATLFPTGNTCKSVTRATATSYLQKRPRSLGSGMVLVAGVGACLAGAAPADWASHLRRIYETGSAHSVLLVRVIAGVEALIATATAENCIGYVRLEGAGDWVVDHPTCRGSRGGGWRERGGLREAGELRPFRLRVRERSTQTRPPNGGAHGRCSAGQWPCGRDRDGSAGDVAGCVVHELGETRKAGRLNSSFVGR
mmetsp:Transcript_41076/g.95977  ORF Transcript_41076/g.95977 Transcript_41076/m.95977 type:complete len:266 (+) Transcript_41076:817-1614(+)